MHLCHKMREIPYDHILIGSCNNIISFAARTPETVMYLRDPDDLSWLRIKKTEDGVYVKGTKNTPLSPQPDESNVIVSKRQFSYGKQPGFKRVHTYISSVRDSDAHLMSRIFVQYCGQMPKPAVHGNARTLKRKFKRTPESVFSKVREMTREGKGVHEIFTTMHKEGDDFNIPKDKKQIKNIRYFMDDPHGSWSRAGNAADEVLELISASIGHPFLREIKTFDDCPPAFICCGKYAIHDIQTYCTIGAKYPAIGSLDRTFSLSRCYVSVFCYQHPMLRRTGTNIVPTLWGPVFCHWRGNFENYYEFLSFIKKKMIGENIRAVAMEPMRLLEDFEGSSILFGGEIEPERLRVGSDEEAAMLKASAIVFDKSCHILCTRHLMDCLRRRLNNSTISPPSRTIIAKRIMDLRTSNTLDIFDHQSKTLGAKIKSKYPEIGKYYDNFIKILRKYVVIPTLRKETDGNYTTQRSESLNSVLKLRTAWKSQRLADLVKILQDLEEAQRIQIRRALYNPGEFELAGPMARLKVSEAQWEEWGREDPQQQLILEAKFHAGPKIKKKKRIESKQNPLFFIPDEFPQLAKKPGVQKRPKSHRTRSIKKPSQIHTVPELFPGSKGPSISKGNEPSYEPSFNISGLKMKDGSDFTFGFGKKKPTAPKKGKDPPKSRNEKKPPASKKGHSDK